MGHAHRNGGLAVREGGRRTRGQKSSPRARHHEPDCRRTRTGSCDRSSVMTMVTKYLGLTLAHPFMAGASPLSTDLDTVKRLEDGGSAAIVLHSLFEEQISLAATGRIHQMDPLEREFAGTLSSFPERYALSPDGYLEHLRRVKKAVGVPVIASLNGMTAEMWLTFAER